MSKTTRNVVILVIVLASLALGIVFRFPQVPIEVGAEKLPSLTLFGILPITNSLLSTWVTMLILIVVAFLTTRSMKLVPEGIQNFMELVIETIYNMVEDVAGEKYAPAFFPLIATIFLFLIISNWMDLLTPIFAAFGFVHEGERGISFIPLFRSPSTDLNTTIALALVSVAVTQVVGLKAQKLGYIGKFINVKGFGHFLKVVQGKEEGSAGGAFAMAFLDLFLGFVELISEFAKIISFSFRLFGNIFAGEVLLLIMPSFLSTLLPLPFLGLEVFVGFIQAFIFAILTLAFMSMATTSMEH